MRKTFDGEGEPVQDWPMSTRDPLPAVASVSQDAIYAALDGLLPHGRQEQLSSLLSSTDLATLHHLVMAGMGKNTLRALTSDLAYLERWCLAATGAPLPWPAGRDLLLKFIAHHLWDPAQKDANPDHGMPDAVASALRLQGALAVDGPHAPSTVRRRLALWRTMHRWRGLDGAFGDGQVRTALRLSARAAARPPTRKSERALTGDLIEAMLRTCWMNRPIDRRDRAILLLAFGSGGRRRSEVAGLRIEDVRFEADIPSGDTAAPLPAASLRLGRTKTTDASDDATAWIVGKPVTALREWLTSAGIEGGALFRAVDQWGNLGRKALSPQAINLIVKKRAALAGLDPAQVSAHGLRSGYLTEAARQGVPLTEAMAQSQHRSVQQAARYYNDAERKMGRAARLLD